MAITARFESRYASTLTNPLDLGTPKDTLDVVELKTMTNGTGADQLQTQFHDQRTLSASGTENLDLAGGLTDAFGATITMTVLKMIWVRAAVGNTNDVEVAMASSNGVPFMNAAGDAILVKPGGTFCYLAPDANGVTVTAGTGDIITVTNSAGGTSVTYDIILAGV